MSTEPMSTAPQSTGVAVAAEETQAPPVNAAATPDVESAPSATRARAAAAPSVVDASTAVSTSTPNRVSKPMIVAATVAGVVLMALPVAFGGLLGDDRPGEDPTPAGYAQEPPPDGGFVPGVVDPQVHDTDGSTSPQPAGSTPGATVDGVPADRAGEPMRPGAPVTAGKALAPAAGAPAGPAGAPVNSVAPAQNPPAAAQPQSAPAATYEAMAGPGCGGTTRFTGVGSYRDGKAGWVDYGNGGCGTSFVSIPMSGDATQDDASAYGLWTFNTGPVAAGTCAVSVFVPSGDITKVGGNPTYYRVYDRFEISKGTPVGSFTVKQVSNLGQWVSVGSFRVSNYKLAVQLLTRGRDWEGSTRTYAHHAAAMVKAKCQA
jgi:hypothetical protein